jgi:DNA polymerase-3 subunit delta'
LSLARICGQDRAKALVAAWLRQGRVPHAVLVSGVPGTGKRFLALELAKALNCQARGEEACGRCPSCRKTETWAHPDLCALLPLSKKERDEREPPPWREVWLEVRPEVAEYLEQEVSLARSRVNIPKNYFLSLRQEMGYAPVEAPWRVALIFEAECMHPAGANALLKILEEPPPHACFILVSSAPQRLLPTVLSRCRHLPLRRLGPGQLAARLAEEGVEPHRAGVAARLGEGSLQRARQVAAGELDQASEQVEQFLQAGVEGQDKVYWELVEELGTDRLRLEQFLSLSGHYLRDLFLLSCQRPLALTRADRLGFLQHLQSRLPLAHVEGLAVELDRGFGCLGRNVHAPLVLAELWRQLRQAGQASARG